MIETDCVSISSSVNDHVIEQLKAEVAYEETKVNLAQKRLALAMAEARSNRSNRSNLSLNSAPSTEINSPPKKTTKVGGGGGGPPDGDPSSDSNNTLEYEGDKSISDEEITTLPTIPINTETLKRHQIITTPPEQYDIYTPATSLHMSVAAENIRRQEALIEQAANELK
jgi:hypothetical protein